MTHARGRSGGASGAPGPRRGAGARGARRSSRGSQRAAGSSPSRHAGSRCPTGGASDAALREEHVQREEEVQIGHACTFPSPSFSRWRAAFATTPVDVVGARRQVGAERVLASVVRATSVHPVVLGYQNSLAIALKGLLTHSHGVPVAEVTWVSTREERVAGNLPAGLTLQQAGRGRRLEDLLLQGEIDALVEPDLPGAWLEGKGTLARLFPEFEQHERAYYEETRLFPIMHPIVVKKEILARAGPVGRGEPLRGIRSIEEAPLRIPATAPSHECRLEQGRGGASVLRKGSLRTGARGQPSRSGEHDPLRRRAGRPPPAAHGRRALRGVKGSGRPGFDRPRPRQIALRGGDGGSLLALRSCCARAARGDEGRSPRRRPGCTRARAWRGRCRRWRP